MEASAPTDGSRVPTQDLPSAHALAHDQRRARRPYTDRRFARSRSDRLLGGVCGGIGEAFGIDPTLVRIAFVIALIAAGGAFVGVRSANVRLVYLLSVLLSLGATGVGYLLLWLLIPAEKTAGR